MKQKQQKIDYPIEFDFQDKLDRMFWLQKQLQKRLGYDFTEFNNNYFNLMYIGCITELSEVIENTKWKPWKQSSSNNILEIKKELIDVFHFLINMCIACNLEPNELFYEFLNKNQENNRRQENGY